MMTEIDDKAEIVSLIQGKLDAARQKVMEYENALAALTGNAAVAKPPSTKYLGKRIHVAIAEWLKEWGKPATEDEIYNAMMAGGAILGRRDPLGQLRRSLKHSVNNKKLIHKDQLYSLPKKN